MTSTINNQTATEKENEQLRLTIKSLKKQIKELNNKHIKSMMTEFEKAKVYDEIVMKLMMKQNNTINQLEEENRRLKNRNKKLLAEINDLNEEVESAMQTSCPRGAEELRNLTNEDE